MGLYFGQSADEFTIRILAVVVMNVRNWFSIYGKFSPMTILNSTYAKDANFQPVSFGVYF